MKNKMKNDYFENFSINEETVKSKNKNKKSSCVNQKIRENANKVWLMLQSSEKYRNHLALETCRRTTESLKAELYDGFSIVLNERNTNKSDKKQKRIMRRIVEKRQAQAAHNKLGRTNDLFITNIEKANVSRCMYEFA